MLDFTPEELIARARFTDIGAIFIDHPRYTPIYQRLRLAVALGGTDDEVPAIQLTGPAGGGKTTTGRKLEQQFRRRKNARTIKLPRQPVAKCDYVPFLMFTCPGKPTVASLVASGLKAIGDPNWDQGLKEPRLNARFDAFVEACDVLAIFIDEAHRAVDREGVVVAAHIAEWLTDLHKAHRVVLILAGLGRIKYLFEDDIQLTRRWDAALRIAPYQWLDDVGAPHEDQDAWIAILRRFRDLSPIPFDLALDVEQDEVAYRFIYAARGVIGLVKKILKKAIMLIAIDADRPLLITLPLLERAYDEGVQGEMRAPFNAFSEAFVPDIRAPLPPLIDDRVRLPTPKARGRRQRKKARRDEMRATMTKA